jgi:hypothetical protein
MSDKLEQAAGDGITKRSALPEEDDVEGHGLKREGEGHSQRRDSEGDGFAKHGAIPDDGDDVEGHSMTLRADDGAVQRRDAEDGYIRRLEPGEGHTSRT